MAQADMICPFSHKACRECSFYRGRHYFLCFCKDYRGYLGTNQKLDNRAIAQRQPPFANTRLPELKELEKSASMRRCQK